MRWPDFTHADLLDAALATTGSVVLALRPDHTVCYWNAHAERLYRLPAAEAVGIDYVARFIAPEQQALIAADIRKVLAGEPTWDFEDDSVLADGSRRTLVWNVRRFGNEQGEVCGIVASGYDITARKEAERTFRLVWDHSTEGLLIGGGPGIVDCNPAALAMLGLDDPAQLIGRHPLEFSPEYQPDGARSAEKARRMDAITRELGEHRFEWVHCRPDGTPVPTAVHVRVAKLDGRPRTVIAWLDLTEQHATVEREAALREQLARAQKLDALGHLAGGIAHDFNNLLSAIGGSVELALADVPPTSGAATELRLALDTTARAAALVRQLLAFGRQREARHTTLDLGELVRASEPLWRRVLPASVALIVEVPAVPAPLLGDASQLEQVCMNLLVNARDAMPEGGELRVRVSVAGPPAASRVCLEVCDTGMGMPPSVLDRVFDPFFTTKPLGSGTGLGLAVVYGVVSAHDGTVSIDSRVGEGTAVRVEFPAAGDVAASVPATSSESNATGAPAGGHTLLLVEDEPAVRGALARLLRRGGYTVLEATHGAEALTLWHEHADRVGMVLSDVRMPVMNGPDLARQLRSGGSRTPVVLMSGFADEALTDALPEGVVRVLAKPFSAADLLAAVRSALAAETMARPATQGLP